MRWARVQASSVPPSSGTKQSPTGRPNSAARRSLSVMTPPSSRKMFSGDTTPLLLSPDDVLRSYHCISHLMLLSKIHVEPSRIGMRSLRQEERSELPCMTGQFLMRTNLSDAPIEEHHDRVG